MINFCNEAQEGDGRVFMVFYAKNFYEPMENIKPERIAETHRFIDLVLSVSAESVYHGMQAEIWSCIGQGRSRIEGAGVSHTSMSVGDVLFDVDEDAWLYCDRIGWKRLD